VSDLAIQSLGAASVGLDPTIEAADLRSALERSGATVVIAEDEEQYDKVTEVRADLGALRVLVIVDPRGITLDPSRSDTITLAQVEASGAAATIDTLATDLRLVTAGHVATIVQGGPDGEVRLTHTELLAGADAAGPRLGLDRSTEVLSYLPLTLPAERVVSLVAAMATRFVVSFGDGGDTFLTDMQQVQPTFLLGVPLVFEQLHTSVERRMEDASFLKRKTYSFWMARGRKLGEARRQGHAGLIGRALHGVGWLALYRPLRVKLGLLRVRGALCAPGTADPTVLDFFWALGVPVHVGHDPTGSADGFLPTDRSGAPA
jgi:long-chain acyl-CoA synthetase